MRYIAVFAFLLFISSQAIAQGYITDGQTKGGLYPYAGLGTAINEGTTGIQAELGIKTYGKDYAPLGGQVELAYMKTGVQSDSVADATASFLNFSFMAAVSTFRKHYNYHLAIGPSLVFNTGDGFALYNFYPRIEAGAGYSIFMLKAGYNFSLNSSYSNLFSVTLCVYPTRKRTWAMDEGN